MTGRLFAGLLSAGALWGQSFHVPPSSVDRNGAGTFSVFLDSPEGKAPVALQWELRVPSAVVITAADVTVGKAAQSAGKSVVCAAGGKGPVPKDGVRYTCILAGGINRIANGPVVVVHYQIQTGERRGRNPSGNRKCYGSFAGPEVYGYWFRNRNQSRFDKIPAGAMGAG